MQTEPELVPPPETIALSPSDTTADAATTTSAPAGTDAPVPPQPGSPGPRQAWPEGCTSGEAAGQRPGGAGPDGVALPGQGLDLGLGLEEDEEDDALDAWGEDEVDRELARMKKELGIEVRHQRSLPPGATNTGIVWVQIAPLCCSYLPRVTLCASKTHVALALRFRCRTRTSAPPPPASPAAAAACRPCWRTWRAGVRPDRLSRRPQLRQAPHLPAQPQPLPPEALPAPQPHQLHEGLPRQRLAHHGSPLARSQRRQWLPWVVRSAQCRQAQRARCRRRPWPPASQRLEVPLPHPPPPPLAPQTPSARPSSVCSTRRPRIAVQPPRRYGQRAAKQVRGDQVQQPHAAL